MWTVAYFIEGIKKIGARICSMWNIERKGDEENFRDIFAVYYEWNSLWKHLEKLK